VVVEGKFVSKKHCIIELDGSSEATSAQLPHNGPGTNQTSTPQVLWVTDISRNGTYVQHAGETIRLRKGVRTAVVLPPHRSGNTTEVWALHCG